MINLRDYLQGIPISDSEFYIWFTVLPSIFAILYYLIKKNRLKFQSIDTNLTREELAHIIDKVANELEWIPHKVGKNIIIAKTYPSFFSGSVGEHITILFDKNRILVNSIYDPAKRSSLVSMGRNKQNMNRLIEEIKKASR